MKAIRVFFYLVPAFLLFTASIALLHEEGRVNKLWIVFLGSFSLLAFARGFRELNAPNSHLSRPPGWGLLRFAETCFSKKTFTQVLEPTLSDMQKEHIEALAAGRLWKARMALVRGYVSFWSAVVAQAPLSVLSLLYKVWKTTKIGS